jgi:hypothetical protein
MITSPTNQGERMELVTVETKRCIHCGETGVMAVGKEGIALRQAGESIQDCFPYLSAPEREQLISGTHPECWDEMFDGAEEYDYQDCE